MDDVVCDEDIETRASEEDTGGRDDNEMAAEGGTARDEAKGRNAGDEDRTGFQRGTEDEEVVVVGSKIGVENIVAGK